MPVDECVSDVESDDDRVSVNTGEPNSLSDYNYNEPSGNVINWGIIDNEVYAELSEYLFLPPQDDWVGREP